MSAGKSASKSSTRTIPPAFSRNTISSPRRKISTSELFTRNFFGNLTAWLFPDLKTRATVMIRLPYIYTLTYIRSQATFAPALRGGDSPGASASASQAIQIFEKTRSIGSQGAADIVLSKSLPKENKIGEASERTKKCSRNCAQVQQPPTGNCCNYYHCSAEGSFRHPVRSSRSVGNPAAGCYGCKRQDWCPRNSMPESLSLKSNLHQAS